MSTTPSFRTSLPLASSIAVLLGLSLAQAQTPAERLNSPAANNLGAAQLPETVVTATNERDYQATVATSATRIEAPILDTPRSVQVVTSEVMRDRAILDPQEAVQNVSGVQRGGSRTGDGETYVVRGFRQGSLIKDGFRAGELSGGSVFTFEGSTDVANLDRVEVLKGPSAILFGRGEPGGTVNYVTRTPVFENRFSLQQQIGSYDFYRTEVHANWDAVPGKFAIGVDAAYQNNESFIDFVDGESVFVAPAFKWQIGPDTVLTFRGEYLNDDQASSLGVPYDHATGTLIPGVPYNRYFGEPGFTDLNTETWRGVLTLDHRWNESHKTTVSLHGVRTETDGGNFILFNFEGPVQDPVTGDVSRAAERIDFTGEYFTARLDHTWDWTIYQGPVPITSKDGKTTTTPGGFPTVKNQFLFSAEYDYQTTDGLRELSSHTPLNPRRPHYTGYSPRPLLSAPGFPLTFLDNRSTEADATSLLVLDRLSFGETVFISFGGRYEWFRANSRYAYSPESGFGFGSDDLDEGTFNPTAGIVVKPSRNVSIYGSWAESTNSFQNIGLTTVSGAQLDPERARQFEAGVKVELFGGKVFTTLALFQIEKTDVADTDPANPFFSINGGDERSRGVEFDIAGEPIPGWRITANYAYTDARVSGDPTGLNTGHRLEGVPEHSGGLFTTYEIQEGALKALASAAACTSPTGWKSIVPIAATSPAMRRPISSSTTAATASARS